MFAAMEYHLPERNTYRAQLVGFDAQPRWLGYTNRIGYDSVPPGVYTLKVWAANANGHTHPEPTTLRVVSHPAFYQRWYVIVGAVVVGIVFVAVVAHWRLASLARYNDLLRNFSANVQDARERERTSVAREVHDELGQLLSTLKMHIYWLSTHAAAREVQRRARYDSMMGLIGATLEWTKETATRLRPVILDNLELHEALTWLVTEGGLPATVHLSHAIEPVQGLPSEYVTTIFRVAQELCTNISRHAEAKHAYVAFFSRGGTLTLIVEDDGRGISRREVTNLHSYGIIGMRERCHALGGTIRFSPRTHRGTRVTVAIPHPTYGTKREVSHAEDSHRR